MLTSLAKQVKDRGRLILSGTAYRGTIWTVGGFGSSQVLRFFSNLILTRLLVPEFFGIMALVNSLTIGLIWLSDFGIGKSIVRSRQWDNPVFLDTAWTLQIIRGFAVWLFVLLISWPIAQVYGDPILAQILPIVGFVAVISGFNSTKLFTLNREMKLGSITMIELGSQAVGLGSMVAVAFVYPSVWALVVYGLVNAFCRMLASHFLLPGRLNQLSWDSASRAEIFAFGRWVWLETTMMFLAEQSDRLILGLLFSLSLLGVYSIAYTLATLPRQVMKRVSSKVIFPLVAGNAELPRSKLNRKILAKRKLVLLGFGALIFSLTCFGDIIIQFLYDDRYIQAAWIMPLLAFGSWFSILFYATSPCLIGVGQPKYPAQANSIRFIVLLIGIPLGGRILGPLGAILAVALSDMPSYLTLQYGTWREQLLFWPQDLRMTLGLVGASGFGLLLRVLLGFEPVYMADLVNYAVTG